MRSVINLANQSGIDAVVKQLFEVGAQIIAGGLVPIIEPEVSIKSPQKAEAEALLKKSLLDYAKSLSGDQNIMLKLDRKSTRLNSSHVSESRMPSSA